MKLINEIHVKLSVFHLLIHRKNGRALIIESDFPLDNIRVFHTNTQCTHGNFILMVWSGLHCGGDTNKRQCITGHCSKHYTDRLIALND